MDLSFCAATPIVPARSAPARCRACMEPAERPPEPRGAARLPRAPEALAALAAVAVALFRDVLRGDGADICARFGERLKEHSARRARVVQIESLREEVAALFEEARVERNRIAYYDTLAERCMSVVTAAKQDNLLEVLADAVRDDSITPPPRGSLLDQRVEQEFWLLLEKARNARVQLRQHVDAREAALKAVDAVDLAGAQSEAEASRKLVEIRRSDLLNIQRSTYEATSTLAVLEKEIADNLRRRDEMLAEAALLGEQLAERRAELEQLRDLAKKYDQLKREDNVRVPIAAPEDANASEAQLRRLKKEISAANDLARKIVDSAREAVKKSEQGDTSAVDSLGMEVRKDIVSAEKEMKKLQKKQTYRPRAKRKSSVRDVLEVAKTEDKRSSANEKKKRKKPGRKAKNNPFASAVTDTEQATNVEDSEKAGKNEPGSEDSSVMELLDVVSTSKAKKKVGAQSKDDELENGIIPPVKKKAADEKSDYDESEDPGELVENRFDEAIAELLDKPLADDVYVEKVQELVEKAAKEVDVQKHDVDIVEPTVMNVVAASSEGMVEKENEGIEDLVGDADNADNTQDYSKSTDMKSMDEALGNMSVEDALLFQEAIEDFKIIQELDKPKGRAGVAKNDDEDDILDIPSDNLLQFLDKAERVVKEDDEETLLTTEKSEVEGKREPVQPWRFEVRGVENKPDTKSEAQVEEAKVTDVESKLKRYSFVEDVKIEPVEDLKLSNSSFGKEEISELLRVVEQSEGVTREGIWLEPKENEVEAPRVKGTMKSDTGAATKAKETVKSDVESGPIQPTTPEVPKPRRGRRRKADVERDAATRRATNASLIEAQNNQMAAASALRKRAKKKTASKPKEDVETTPQLEPTAETDSKPVKKRGRPRKTAAVATELVEETGTEVVVEKKKRSRPRKTPTKTEATSAVEDNGVVAVVEKKKRGRPRKNAVVATPVTESETAEEKPKRGRRKTAGSVSESETNEEKRRRGRKKAVSVTATAATESDAEVKPKRTKKKLPTSTATESETEVEPKRTRTKAATASVSESESEAEEKPKRGRKKTVSVTVTDSESGTEEKSKRTRKKGVAVTGSESETEEKPKRKRGRPRKIKADNEET